MGEIIVLPSVGTESASWIVGNNWLSAEVLLVVHHLWSCRGGIQQSGGSMIRCPSDSKEVRETLSVLSNPVALVSERKFAVGDELLSDFSSNESAAILLELSVGHGAASLGNTATMFRRRVILAALLGDQLFKGLKVLHVTVVVGLLLFEELFKRAVNSFYTKVDELTLLNFTYLRSP